MNRIEVGGYAWAMQLAIRALKPPAPSQALLVFRVRQLARVAEVAVSSGCFDLVEDRLLRALAAIPRRHRPKIYRLVLSERVRDALRGNRPVHTSAPNA